jgi:hypothetical protein
MTGCAEAGKARAMSKRENPNCDGKISEVYGLTNNRAPPTFATRWIDLGSLATRVKKAK